MKARRHDLHPMKIRAKRTLAKTCAMKTMQHDLRSTNTTPAKKYSSNLA